MSEQRSSSYAVIPSYILDDDDLDEGAKTLYARISMYSQDGRCWASNKHFAEKQKVTTRCIQLWLKQLVDKGYIVVEVETGSFQTKRDIWITNDFKKHYTKRTTVHPPANCSSPPPAPQFTSIDKYKDINKIPPPTSSKESGSGSSENPHKQQLAQEDLDKLQRFQATCAKKNIPFTLAFLRKVYSKTSIAAVQSALKRLSRRSPESLEQTPDLERIFWSLAKDEHESHQITRKTQ